MADLKTLVAKRAQIKSLSTRFKNYLTLYQENNQRDLELRLDRLKSSLKDFEDIQLQIELIDETEVNTEETENFEAQYFSLICEAEAKLARKPNRMLGENIEVKLPTINLPNFSGQYDQWLSFHDTFQSLIEENTKLSEVQKLHYLKSCLKGEAAQVLSSLEISAANYKIAWDLLRERYENKRLIIQNHIKLLVEASPINKESHQALRQLLDGALQHIRTLKGMGEPVEHWSSLLVYLITSKLDSKTRRAWEENLKTSEMPTFKELEEFLIRKCQLLDCLHTGKENISATQPKRSSHHVAFKETKCSLCKTNHSLYQCEKFLKLPVSQRLQQVKSLHLCINCLRGNHLVRDCHSRGCKTCSKKHNTLLHMESNTESYLVEPSTSNNKQQSSMTYSSHSASIPINQVLLSTAVIHIADKHGQFHEVRALLDSGSQVNFVTKRLAQKLNLKQESLDIPIAGINGSSFNIRCSIMAKIKSRVTDFSEISNFLIMKRITGMLPTIAINRNEIYIPKNLKLADPEFHKPREIDVLLGAEMFFDLMCVGQIKSNTQPLVYQKTKLGWIASGRVPPHKSSNFMTCNFASNLEALVQKFWQIEEKSYEPIYNKEELACEESFTKTVTRDVNGRFVVELPMAENATGLGNSRDVALKRLYSLERRLNKQPEVKRAYHEFMNEYIVLGHMRLLADDKEEHPSYYIPHHPVMKESSQTTKLRVVFDASAPTSNSKSLNDILLVGPTIQQSLISIVLRFRTHKYVLTADIAKMYRQILVKPSQRKLQRILWRTNTKENVRTYELNTITYGTAPASFLATRCLKQLAVDERENYPLASRATLTDFYMDDILTGADTYEEAVQLRNELLIMLNTAGFELRKWSANCQELLSDLPVSCSQAVALFADLNSSTRTLGISWNSKDDTVEYTIPTSEFSARVTKRNILSKVAGLFDPLGLIGPIIVTAKILIQRLWQLRISWDESVPIEVHSSWLAYQQDLQRLVNYRIPRCVVGKDDIKGIEIHGFSDASELAYGACIYIRTINNSNERSCHLLCAKSRVAPLKELSIPRLELCGATLLVELMDTVAKSLELACYQSYYWTDSTIVLSWIRSDPRKLKTFVSNRIGEIQRSTQIPQWKHVNSACNPADIISRGCTTESLITSRLWWHGPDWLLDERLPNTTVELEANLPELKVLMVTDIKNNDFDLFERFSSLNKLIRVVAMCFRFFGKLKRNVKYRNHGPVTSREYANVTKRLIYIVQEAVFSRERQMLKRYHKVQGKSRLLCLNPFLDNDDLIRVGGRLRHSGQEYDMKHPIVIPASHTLTKLIVKYEHERQLHAGTQGTLAAVRAKYWPINGQSTVRQIVRKCVTCVKARPLMLQPLMGDLPASRTEPIRPFTRSGVDYCGPLYVKEGQRRSKKLVKCYVAVFVCFATKAVHLELVSDLTTEAFIAALKRFMARRGKVAHIYSDNATNFVGANNELRELEKLFKNEEHQQCLQNAITTEGVTWHFTPARSPHFGGLWEAAVKSAKQHLRRIARDAALTYEETYTFLVQIEAILNSRPLTAISNDPNDTSFLSPSHFLIGDVLTSTVEPDLREMRLNKLSRWQHIQQMQQHFWSRWSKEYLSLLQERKKWRRPERNQLRPGQLVLIKEDNLQPFQWKTGRVEDVHPGSDGVVRAATVRVSRGLVKRSATKLCILPVDQD